MDRATLVNDICKEAGIRQPNLTTEGYLPKRILTELLLTLKKMKDELQHLESLKGIANAENETKAANG